MLFLLQPSVSCSSPKNIFQKILVLFHHQIGHCFYFPRLYEYNTYTLGGYQRLSEFVWQSFNSFPSILQHFSIQLFNPWHIFNTFNTILFSTKFLQNVPCLRSLTNVKSKMDIRGMKGYCSKGSKTWQTMKT